MKVSDEIRKRWGYCELARDYGTIPNKEIAERYGTTDSRA